MNRTRSKTRPAAAALAALCRAAGLPAPITEYAFHPTRKWRFDAAWPQFMVALEIDGGVFGGPGRMAHAVPTAIHRDMIKHRQAALLGWRVLRYLPRELTTVALPDLELFFKYGACYDHIIRSSILARPDHHITGERLKEALCAKPTSPPVGYRSSRRKR